MPGKSIQLIGTKVSDLRDLFSAAPAPELSARLHEDRNDTEQAQHVTEFELRSITLT
jgi:hypothetical protein